MKNHSLKIKIPVNRESLFSGTIFLSFFNYGITLILLGRVFFEEIDFKIILLLPLIYSLLFSLTRRKFNYLNPGIFVVNLIAFIRYLAIPFLILVTDQLSSMKINYNYIDSAVIFMIVEMIAIFFTALIYNPKVDTQPIKYVKSNKLIKLSSIIFFILLIASNQSLIGNLTISGGQVYFVTQSYSVSGVIGIIWQAICVYIFCYLVNDLYQKNKMTALWLSLGLCLIYVMIIFTGQVTLSRWYAVVTILASMFWLFKLYPNRKNQITLIAVSVRRNQPM